MPELGELGYSTQTGTLGWAWLLHRRCLDTTLSDNQIWLIKWEGDIITNPTGASQWGATYHRDRCSKGIYALCYITMQHG